MTPDELRALIEELDRKARATIVFGPDGATQFIFSPSKGRVEGAARWKVDLKGTTSRHDLQRELSKANRGLLDKEKGESSVAFKAVEQLLACYTEIERQFRRTLLLLLLRRLREDAKQDGEAAEDTPFTYPKPQLETLREELATVSERLETMSKRQETVSDQLMMAQDAIVLVVEALSKDAQSREEGGVSGPKGKLQIAFDLLRGGQWPEDVTNLQNHAWFLAGKLQRPPTKAELRERYDPRMDPAQFSRLLKPAGLSWLPGAKSLAT
jgi:hypothetical protein